MTNNHPINVTALLLAAALASSTAARAQSPTATATTVAAYVTDAYSGPCSARPVQVDLWYHNGTSYEFHDRCYTNGSADPNPGSAVCYFKHPMPLSTNTSAVLVRSWKIDPSCSTYLDQVAPNDPASYVDVHPVSATDQVQADGAFDAYPDRLVRLATSTYEVAIDRNGGAIYEFHNKRATDASLPAGVTESAIHAHFGAALQVAFHSGAAKSLTSAPCGGQGYWNPTQAGASCTFDGTSVGTDRAPQPGTAGLSLLCDGVSNNVCTSATSSVEHTPHTMMNWDYGQGYTGPYNALDTSLLSQTATAQPNFLQVDVTLLNTGIPRNGVLEAPTFYFTDRYRRFFAPAETKVDQIDIPVNLTGIDANNFGHTIEGNPIWVCFENRGLTSENNFVTLGILPGRELGDLISASQAHVSEGPLFDNVKFNYAASLNYLSNLPLSFRYVVFPFRYDEPVGTEFGTLSVADTIEAMFKVYSNHPPRGYLDGIGADGTASGWALDRDSAPAPIDVQFFLDGPVGSGSLLGNVTAKQPRPDVNQATGLPGDHGYGFALPSSVYDGLVHTLYAYGVDDRGVSNTLLEGSGVKFTLGIASSDAGDASWATDSHEASSTIDAGNAIANEDAAKGDAASRWAASEGAEASGCSCASTRPIGGAWWTWLSLGALIALARRVGPAKRSRRQAHTRSN